MIEAASKHQQQQHVCFIKISVDGMALKTLKEKREQVGFEQ
jgi:hypothetical protein